METLTKAAEDLGFKRASELRVAWIDLEQRYWYRVTQPLENDELGCPKVLSNEEQSHFHQCRVEMSVWNDLWADETWYWRSSIKPLPKLLGATVSEKS